MYSFVVLSARSALLLLFLSRPPVSCIPDSSRAVHSDFIWPFALFFPRLFSGEIVLGPFSPLSFLFFSLWLRFSPVSVLNCGWHVRALAKPSLRRQVFMAGYVHNGAFQYSE